MTSVPNERLRLTCGWINMLATLLAAGGMLAPIALAFASTTVSPVLVLLLSLIWFGTAIKLHVVARFLLGRLES